MGLCDKVKFNLSKSEDKLKLFILVSGTLLFLLVATVGGISMTMSPNFCKLCHKAMNPEYVTWKYSSHSQIACVDCHMESGVVSIIKEKLVASKHLYTYLTDGYEEEKPIKMKTELPSHLCTNCHSMKNRGFSLSGDLKDPHSKHDKVGVGCIQCHSGAAHGNIAEREVSTGDLAAWTDKNGMNNMTAELVRPDMDTCVACHINPRKYGVDHEPASWKCEACHEAILTPDTHKDQVGWSVNHGLDAEKDLQGCIVCHAMGVQPTYAADGVKNNKINPGEQAKDFAWKNEYCINCHSKKPKNHEDKSYWLPNHRDVVGSKQMKNCLACHSIQKPKAGETLASPAKEVACNNCHWFK